MRALTIRQPYAHLIVTGRKRVENRSWPTRVRGTVAIHAGKNRSELLLSGDDATEHGYGIPLSAMAFGAIVGLADVVDCLPIAAIRDGQYDDRYPWLRQHSHTHGPWCFVLANVRRIVSIPTIGKQGFFNVDLEGSQCQFVD